MRRREFITLLTGAAVWSLGAKAQQPMMPIIGLLSSVPFETRREQLAAFHRGLSEAGYLQGQNVAIEYRSAENQTDRMPTLAAELVNQRVAVIVTIGGDISSRAAKAATNSIPIVFVTGFDPVKAGLVASLNHPGGNLTGVSFLVSLTAAKRLELLHEMAPSAITIGFLVNPVNPNAETTTGDAQAAAAKLGKKLIVGEASTDRDLDMVFAAFAQNKVEGVLVEADPFFLARPEQVISLATRYALPAIYSFREFAAIGGLMSYGTSLANAYHQAGVYAAKILNGEKPADLPVVQPTEFELVINLKTAKTLGIRVPLTASGRRRGDRIEIHFAAVHESVVGTKRSVADRGFGPLSGGERTCKSNLTTSTNDPTRTLCAHR